MDTGKGLRQMKEQINSSKHYTTHYMFESIIYNILYEGVNNY